MSMMLGWLLLVVVTPTVAHVLRQVRGSAMATRFCTSTCARC